MNLAAKLALISSAAAVIATAASAQTQVDLVSGRLSLITPNGDQAVSLEVGPTAGTARVYGFPGLADGTEYFGVSGITLVTGEGNDKIEFDIGSPQSLDIRVDTQGGEAETTVVWDILSGVDHAVAALSLSATGGRMGLAAVDIASEVADASISVDTGPAAEVSTKVISPNTSDYLGVTFQSAGRKSTLEIDSAASILEATIGGGQTTGARELKYAIKSTPARVALSWDIQTGNGPDKIEAKIDASGSTVTHRGEVNARGGNDLVRLETDAFSTVTGLIVRGGAGADALAQILKGRFQASQTLQARLIGGAGNDQLQLTTDTGIFGTGLPNDLFPVINCGDGLDRYNAFGRIIACEGRL